MMKNGLPPARSAISAASASSMRRPEACRARSIDSSGESGSSRSRTAFAVRRAPRGPLLEQAGAGEHEDEGLAVAVAGGRAEAFDQLEHRRAERVRVLEHEHGGRVAREAVDERDEPGLHVLHERRLSTADRPSRTGARAVRRRARRRRVVDVAVCELAQPAPRLLGRVVLLQPGELGHDRRRRRERRRVGERAGAAGEHGDVVARRAATSSSARRDLPMPGSPRTLTSTGWPVSVARWRLSRRIASSLERPTNGIVRRAERGVSPSTGKPASVSPSNPFARGLRLVAVGDGVRRERDGGLAGEHLARFGGGLEPGGGVHDGPGDQELAGRAEAGGRLARLDADVDVEGCGETEGLAQPAGPGADRETGTDGAERVVLVHGRQSEHRHHGVADELLRPGRGARGAPRTRRRRSSRGSRGRVRRPGAAPGRWSRPGRRTAP